MDTPIRVPDLRRPVLGARWLIELEHICSVGCLNLCGSVQVGNWEVVSDRSERRLP